MKFLTERQQRFIDGILAGKSQLRAFHDAGYAITNNRHADVAAASKLMSILRPEVEHQRLPIAKKLNLAIQDTVLETERIAYFDPGEVMSWGPDGVEVKHSADLTAEQRRMVSEVSVTVTEHMTPTGGTMRSTRTKIKLIDRQRALEKLGEYQGLGAGAGDLHLHLHRDAAGDAAKELERIRSMTTEQLIAERAKIRDAKGTT